MMMLRLFVTRVSTPLLALALVATGATARASDGPNSGSTAPTAPAGAPAPIDEQLRQQSVLLQQLQDLLVKQQAEIEHLKVELDAVRSAAHPAATDAAPGEPATATSTATIVPGATPAP